MFVPGLGSRDIGLVTLALDLSFGSWAFSPASFLIRNYVCVSELGSWDVGLVTPALDLSFGSWAFGPASFSKRNHACWASIELVFWKLRLRPSFILNKKLCMFLELDFCGIALVTPALNLLF